MNRLHWTAVSIALFSAADGVLTLRHLQHFPEGEANPVMAALIASTSPGVFLLVKGLIVGLGCVGLVRFGCRRTLNLMASLYVLLMLYHVFIIVHGG